MLTKMPAVDTTQLVNTALIELTRMVHHGHTAVKVDSKVADGVSWSNFFITMAEVLPPG